MELWNVIQAELTWCLEEDQSGGGDKGEGTRRQW